MKQFAKVESGSVVEVITRPTWISAEGWLPVVDARPQYDPNTTSLARRPVGEWDVGAGSVSVTYTATPIDIGAMDQARLNAALAAEGSVVRALALVLLQEINTLRQKASLPQYTQAQLVATLKSRMR